MSRERPVSHFLALVTRETVAYGSDGTGTREDGSLGAMRGRCSERASDRH